MTMQEASYELKKSLLGIYDPREASNIAEWAMEDLTGINHIDRIMHAHRILTEEQLDEYHEYVLRLTNGMPVQYVTGYGYFMGLRFRVNEDVLIPRPETEELVHWAIEEGAIGQPIILDIGTGSGCIPIMMKKKIPLADVHTLDVSGAAITVAKDNARIHETDINFHHGDFLDAGVRSRLPASQLIISNPPYIPISEKEKIHPNVVQFEPHLALFVKNEDPLLFYRAIAVFGKEKLMEGGRVFLEINEDLGEAVVQLAISFGYNIELKKDLQGKDRMVMMTL